jgi:hypothetical protein
MPKFDFELKPVADPFAMTKEEEADYWNGIGHLEILVTYVNQKEKIFEFEVIDQSGCVGGIEEAIGIDYLLTQMWSVQKPYEEGGFKFPLKAGYSYTFHDIRAFWTRGDGYTTDDDVDYYHGLITRGFNPWTWLRIKIGNLWWDTIGWRLR